VCRFVQSTSSFLVLLSLLAGWQMAQSGPSGEGQGVTSGLSGSSIAHPDTREPGPSEVALGTQSPSSARRAGLAGLRQLPTAILPLDDPSLSPHVQNASSAKPLPRDILGRRIPAVTSLSELSLPDLASRAVPLPEANTLAHANFHDRRFGRLQTAEGERLLFNPQSILVKFKDQPRVSVLATEPGRELEVAKALANRPDVEFAELDLLQRQAFAPNDPLIGNQWHHQKIGSFAAWDKSLGQSFIRIAIVDAPFQMDHPDLAPHTVSGWDAVANQPVMASSGIHHSTFSAGMAAAVIGNGLGVAGASNCELLPININGFTSEMCNAVYWAATNGVRVVNISWTGADSDALNAAGAYLRLNARGILAMPGLNGPGFVDYPNQPDIWCISMTDAADNQQSAYGYHVDFAAPGWQVYSTTISNGYAFDSGTSYATPLFCGVVAVLFSINPALGPDEVIGLLKSTAADKGPPGWDMWYGWGRINFGAAAAAVAATLPVLSGTLQTNGQFCLATSFKPGLNYTLWRSPTLSCPQWAQVPNAVLSTSNAQILWTDPSRTGGMQFYRVRIALP
jgi:subtilisin family serine protease